MSSASKSRRTPLALQLWAILAVGAIGLSFIVGTIVSDRQRRDAMEQAHATARRAAEALAQRSAPLLDRGDELRLAVLAASVADVSAARVLLVTKDGRIKLDTGLSLGGQSLDIESSDGPIQRQLADGTWEIVRPALANSGFVGEVRLRYRVDAIHPGFAWDVFGVALLCGLSLVVLAWWLVHHWVLQLRKTIERVRSIGTDHRTVLEPETPGTVLGDISAAARAVHLHVDEERRRAREAGLELGRRLVRSIEQRGLAIPGHGERTRRYAMILAEASGLPEKEWNDLGIAASLIDLGKAAVRSSALTAGGAELSTVERESLRFAPARAAEFLSGLPITEHITAAIRHQHEKWDGSGYPEGLRGDRIPFAARILTIADAYDLLTSDDARCEGLSWPEALDRMHEDRGEHFDPALLDAFEDAVRANPLPSATSESVVLAAERRAQPSACVPYKLTDDIVEDEEADVVEELQDELESDFELEVLLDDGETDEESRS